MSKIAIRVDANEIIATGHIMRCLTIADSLKKAGAEVSFISADDRVAPYTDSRGYDLHILGTEWDDYESEVPYLTDHLTRIGADKLLVDSYSVTHGYFKALKDAGVRVIYMDDLCKEVYPADGIINYCPAAETLGYEALYPDGTGLFLGSGYIPLREQFADGETDHGDGLLITAGGADGMGLADIMVRHILAESGLGYADSAPGRIHVLAGRFYRPSRELLDSIDSGLVILHQNVENVAEVMKKCRVAISSAGTTLFELCAMGVVTADYVFADNQMIDAMYFQRTGLMPYMGDFRVSINRCMDHIIDFLYDVNNMPENDLKQRSQALRSVIDGRGADRTAEALIAF